MYVASDSILTILQAAAKRSQLPTPSTIINNTNQNAISLAEFLTEAGRDLASAYEWPELTREHTFILSQDTESYVLPVDFGQFVHQTHWSRDDFWPLIGPINPAEWQYRKSGLLSTGVRQRYRVRGWDTTQFYIDPLPSSSDAGKLMVFEYISETWLRPATQWTLAASISAGSLYRYENSGVYTSVASGTTGGTPTAITATTTSTATSIAAVSYCTTITNTGAVTVYYDLDDSTAAATTASDSLTAGSAITINRTPNQTHIALLAASGTSAVTITASPSHTTGSLKDGYSDGVSWTAVNYDIPIADTDVPLLDPELLIAATRWRFKREKGLEYAELRSEAEQMAASAYAAKAGAPILSASRRRNSFLIGLQNVPDTGFGS